MSIYGWFKGTGASGFGYTSTAEDVTDGLDLAGKTYLLTGCNSGLGYETLRVLTARGATVIGAARSMDKASQACGSVTGKTVPLVCELSEPQSVRAAVERVRGEGHDLDGIIANAGIMMLPKRTVKHGLELQFLTNHVGHFILVTGLVPQLAPDARVVMLSSYGHNLSYREGIRLDDLDAAKAYDRTKAYGQAKLANLLFANHLATRLSDGQAANSVHPGVIATNLVRHIPKAVMAVYQPVAQVVVNKTIPQGAATQCYVATHPGLGDVTGTYFADCNVAKTSHHGRDAELARQLWDKTEELVAAL